MDLEACDSMPHNLLIAKLEYYGVDKATLRLLLDYLICRKQRTKIGLSSLGVILIQVYYNGQSLVLFCLIYIINDLFKVRNM